METLRILLDDLESKIASKDSINPLVSTSNVSWHIAHSLKVINAIAETVKISNPEEYQWRFNFSRSLINILGFIPRGKGKAPKAVLPTDVQTSEQLREALQTAKQMLLELEHLDGKSHFMHPYFGQLNLKQTKKFLAIHTKHHLKIIDDILKA
jgi:hypothetical protein